MTSLSPVTNAEWKKFSTHLFPNGATAINREGLDALLESRRIDPRVIELESLLSNIGNPVDADQVLIDALETTAEALEMALGMFGVCGQGDAKDHRADADSFGGTGALAMARNALRTVREA